MACYDPRAWSHACLGSRRAVSCSWGCAMAGRSRRHSGAYRSAQVGHIAALWHGRGWQRAQLQLLCNRRTCKKAASKTASHSDTRRPSTHSQTASHVAGAPPPAARPSRAAAVAAAAASPAAPRLGDSSSDSSAGRARSASVYRFCEKRAPEHRRLGRFSNGPLRPHTHTANARCTSATQEQAALSR